MAETDWGGKERKIVKLLSRVQLFATPWTVAYQAPPSMGFSRPEYWNGLPFPSPGDLPNPGIDPKSPALSADALPSELPGKLRGKLSLVLMGGAMLSKSLIQFSVDRRGCVPSVLFDLRPNYGGGSENNGDLLQKVPCTHCLFQCSQPCSRPPPTHASTGDSWTLMGKSGSVSCGVAALFSWVLAYTRFCLCPPWVCVPSPG